MESNHAAVEAGKQYVTLNYGRVPIAMVRGAGSRLWDADGKQYVDLFAGFGAGILGHCHPDLVRAASEQAAQLWHVGNTFWTVPQIEVAERLSKFAFPGRSFFCQSGAEANEAACKLARLRGQQNGGKKWKIISLHKSFHGRTLAMIAATGSTKYREGFKPDVPGFINVEGGDFDALLKAVDDETAGIIMEPIQGEGGINIYPDGYIQNVRKLCDERQFTLIFDEVWTGFGRTGKWFGHQNFTDASGKIVTPDVMSMGKAIGGGLPVGAIHAKPELAALYTPGKHASTLGANCICMAVTRTIIDVIDRDKLVENATKLGEFAVSIVKGNKQLMDKVAEVRGMGVFLGIEMKQTPTGLVERALENGVVINVTADKVVRIAPALNISRQDLEEGMNRLIKSILSA